MFDSVIAKRKFCARTLLILGSVTLAACGQNGAVSSTKIYGGLAVAKDQRLNVVAITNGDGIFCSGTAITPKLIITAAHCVIGENVELLKVYTGEGLEGGDVKGQYAVSAMDYNPAYDQDDDDSAFDTGYLVLKEALDIPSDSYIPMLTNPAEINELLTRGIDSYLVGFGTRNKHGYGVKYEVKSPVKKVFANEITIGANGKDACQGDSGGPAFGQLKSGEWRVYGVVSRGGACGNGGYWGLMHKNACWIEKASGVNLNLPADYCATSSKPAAEAL